MTSVNLFGTNSNSIQQNLESNAGEIQNQTVKSLLFRTVIRLKGMPSMSDVSIDLINSNNSLSVKRAQSGQSYTFTLGQRSDIKNMIDKLSEEVLKDIENKSLSNDEMQKKIDARAYDICFQFKRIESEWLAREIGKEIEGLVN